MPHSEDDTRDDVERPDDERGSHNRLGYLNSDETDTSSERGAEEPDVDEEVDQAGDGRGDRPARS
jgi:hypothetical protein